MNQSNMEKDKIIILVISILLAVLLMLIGVIWSYPINYSQLLMGAGGGYLIWVCSYYVTNWIDSSSKKHHDKTVQIYNVVSQQYLSLEEKRREARANSFYSPYYENANEIKISGLANTPFIRYLVDKEERSKSNHILNLMKKQPIKVEVLMMDPMCEIVSEMDRIESGGLRKHRHFINMVETLTLVNNFYEDVKSKNMEAALKVGSSLDIRLCKSPLNTTIFYANSDVIKGDHQDMYPTLLMGMLYAHKLGEQSQLFRVPKPNDDNDESLFQDCKEHFKKMFDCSIGEQFLILEAGKTPEFNSIKYEDILKAAASAH